MENKDLRNLIGDAPWDEECYADTTGVSERRSWRSRAVRSRSECINADRMGEVISNRRMGLLKHQRGIPQGDFLSQLGLCTISRF